jgi:hypothetical protein
VMFLKVLKNPSARKYALWILGAIALDIKLFTSILRGQYYKIHHQITNN